MTMVSATLTACLLGSRAHRSRGAECRVCRMTVISRWTASCVDDSHHSDDDDKSAACSCFSLLGGSPCMLNEAERLSSRGVRSRD